MNTLGSAYRVTLFGESHGNVIGCVIDGAPAGVPLTEQVVQPALDRRRPGQSSVTTPRSEADQVKVLAGTHQGVTTGAPVLMLIENKDTDSTKYEEFLTKPRPAHADYTARVRYQDHNDHRGGGQFSGRLTAPLVMAGALAEQVLTRYGIEAAAHTVRIADVDAPRNRTVDHIRQHVESNPVRCADPDTAEAMEAAIHAAREANDSVGGVVEAVVEGLPPGLGTPIFRKFDATVSHALMSLPAIKGVEIGDGFRSTDLRGSEHNDPFHHDDAGRIRTTSNHAGGVLGGLSSGMPFVVRAVFKPASSIGQEQDTIDLETGEPAKLTVEGRHDPSVVPRAVPVVEAVLRIAILDLLLETRGVHSGP